MSTQRSIATRELVTAALVTAMISAAAFVSIPMGTVPVTLQVFVVVLAALLLRPAAAVSSMALYLLLGAIGVPVFAGAAGGLGVLAGPTGGYLFGFLVGAGLGSLVRNFVPRMAGDIAAAGVTILVIYAFGWAQLAALTAMSPAEAFVAGVAPFIAFDVAKAAVAIAVATAVRRAGYGR